MKYTRILAALLAVIMMLSLAACGKKTGSPAAAPEATQAVAVKGNAEDAAYYDWETGVVIRQWPEAFQPYAENAYIICNALNEDFSIAILEWVMENPEDPDGFNLAYYAAVLGSSNPAITYEDAVKVLEGLGASQEEPDNKLEEITTKSGQKIWVMRNSGEDGGISIEGVVTPEQQAAYEAMYESLDELLAQMEFVKPIARTASGKVSFNTVDLDGNPVDSSVFANAEYTMINVWASFCSPCIGEMGELMQMDAEMENVQIITILGDARDVNDDTAEEARDIVDTLKLTLPVYLVNDEIAALLPFDAFPTSFMVDREGNPVGDACVGAVGVERYQQWIEKCIAG